MKIRICDNKIEGHHKVYFDSLLKMEETYLKLSKYNLNIGFKKNLIKYMFQLRKLMEDYTKNSKNEIIHFLVVDNLYLGNINLNNIIGVGTLHQIPKNSIKRIFLKKFIKKLKYVIVHSEFLKEELESMKVKNVKVINYPSFYNYKSLNKIKLKSKFNIKQNKIVLSCLGGTRKDKGLNILLESTKYLKLEIREKVLINIAGKAEYYREEFIKRYNDLIELKINLKVLSEDEFKENIIITDIMIMPYLKTFGGNSGPMTEAIVNKIPCITPKELNIGKINLKNNLGEVFECENPKSLAKAIERTIENLDKGIYYNTDFYKELTEEKFLAKYKKIYEEVWSDLKNE